MSKMNQGRIAATALAGGVALLLAGCHLNKAYQRPDVPAAPAYRGAVQAAGASDASAAAQPAEAIKSLGDEQWFKVFDDPVLVELIRQGIAQNYDLRIAAERVTQARAQLGIAHADQLPSLNGTGSFASQQYAKGQMGTNPDPILTNMGGVGLGAAWNLDFWGKYREATTAARAQLLASEWARRAVLDTVIADIATAYIELRTLDKQKEIAAQTLQTRQESLKLTETLEHEGSDSMLDVREAEQLVYSAQAQISDLDRLIEQQEDTLSTLLGETPHAIARGNSIDRQPAMPEIPAGLPSELLERRPDIKQAEALLMAAHAEIGVARAAYFPQIALTGSAGTNTNALSRLFTGPSYAWNYGPSMSVPIFDAHRIGNNVRMSESAERQAVLSYQQSIAAAFRDVSKGLVGYRRYREVREQQQKVVDAAADALKLSRLRYEHGHSSYLDVLTNDRALLAAQLDLATAKGNELLSLVQLYQSLGGGWKE